MQTLTCTAGAHLARQCDAYLSCALPAYDPVEPVNPVSGNN